MSNEIEQFAKLLVKLVRDQAIRNSDGALKPNAQYAKAKRWKNVLHENPELIVRTIIPDIVDEVIFCLLNAIDNEHINLSFQTVDGTSIDLCDDGYAELAGWYIGSNSWREKYSTERFNSFDAPLD